MNSVVIPLLFFFFCIFPSYYVRVSVFIVCGCVHVYCCVRMFFFFLYTFSCVIVMPLLPPYYGTYENLFPFFPFLLLCFCAHPFCCIFTHLQAYKHTYRNANNPIWRADYCRLHGFVFYFDVLANFFLSFTSFSSSSATSLSSSFCFLVYRTSLDTWDLVVCVRIWIPHWIVSRLDKYP